jgi:hypothetical protein
MYPKTFRLKLRFRLNLRTGGLAHAVALVEGDVKAEEVLEGLPGHGGGPDAQNFRPVQAQVLLDLAENELLGDGIRVAGGGVAF